MRSWTSRSLGVLLAFVTWGTWGCTLVPNPALAGGESTSDASTSTGDAGTSTGDAGTSTSDASTSTGEPGTSTGDASDSSDTGIAPACGNGIVEGAEACDEQGPTATCDEDCTPVSCGDALVNAAAGEACDEGGATETCNPDCTLAGCGDGVLNVAAGEQCDEGGESASCDGDCTFAACGDGVTNVPAGEACDDGGQSALCDVDCTVAECGDGIFNTSAGEACDAAGRTGACNLDCTLAECGDGYVNAAAGELCDDSGESAVCNADCTLAGCGDGITNASAGEDCDDAGASLGCDADCSVVQCGDSVINVIAGEACDGADLGGATCSGEGFVGGTLSCDALTCQFDTAGCSSCGDGIVSPPAEQCDGGDLGGATCVSQGFDGGTLGCDAACAYESSGCAYLPGVPVLSLGFLPIKRFDFSWAAVMGADYYQLEESIGPGEPFVQLGVDVVGTSVSFEMPLHLRREASYVLRACNWVGCTDSAVVDVVGSLAEAVGYVKASNTGSNDELGYSVALSPDGSTLAVGARDEDSNATGVGGNQANGSASGSGAVYVYTRDGLGAWSQQAYVKASNTETGDQFGESIALSGDGSTLAVGAYHEDSNATGVGGNHVDNSALESGAVYVYTRDGLGAWSQQAYVKASNTEAGDRFGSSVALSADGSTLAVGARDEDSNATGVGGNQADNSAAESGAVYVYTRDGLGVWSQQAYVKASNTNANDFFSPGLALSGDGNTLAVGAYQEDSNATNVGGNQANNSASSSGAVYVYTRDGLGVWSQQAYVKASNTNANDRFGANVPLSADGSVLGVGARREDSNATGVGGNQADNSALESGAVYVYTRDGLGLWSHQAYVKASNTAADDQFGSSVKLSADGSTLAVGAANEDSNATGVGGNQADDGAAESGAVYVYTRDGLGVWSHQAYVKASNTAGNDQFGEAMSLSGDGSTLAIGAAQEDSNATGIGGDQTNNSAFDAGAVYLY